MHGNNVKKVAVQRIACFVHCSLSSEWARGPLLLYLPPSPPALVHHLHHHHHHQASNSIYLLTVVTGRHEREWINATIEHRRRRRNNRSHTPRGRYFSPRWTWDAQETQQRVVAVTAVCSSSGNLGYYCRCNIDGAHALLRRCTYNTSAVDEFDPPANLV